MTTATPKAVSVVAGGLFKAEGHDAEDVVAALSATGPEVRFAAFPLQCMNSGTLHGFS